MSEPDRAAHEVLNQPPPLVGFNAYLEDRALADALEREGAAWADPRPSPLLPFVEKNSPVRAAVWCYIERCSKMRDP